MAWELFRRETEAGLEMIGVDSELLATAPLSTLPLACEISVEAPSTRPEFLGPTESALDAVTARIDGRIAGTSRTATRLSTLTYLPTDDQAHRYTQIPLPAKSSVTVVPARDPDWTLFDELRPRDMEMQSMEDLRTMADLHAAGDIGGVREVEHTVRDLDPDRAADFAAAVRRLGFTADALDGDSMVLRHRADPADLTADSWTLRLVAERHDATYSGWSCDLALPEPQRRRKWFGRR